MSLIAVFSVSDTLLLGCLVVFWVGKQRYPPPPRFLARKGLHGWSWMVLCGELFAVFSCFRMLFGCACEVGNGFGDKKRCGSPALDVGADCEAQSDGAVLLCLRDGQSSRRVGCFGLSYIVVTRAILQDPCVWDKTLPQQRKRRCANALQASERFRRLNQALLLTMQLDFGT
jgi:hypothetical protein